MIGLNKIELMPHVVDARIMGIDDDGMLDALNLVAQAQLKKYTNYLNSLKGDVVERDGEWFATFEMPLKVWNDLSEEVKNDETN